MEDLLPQLLVQNLTPMSFRAASISRATEQRLEEADVGEAEARLQEPLPLNGAGASRLDGRRTRNWDPGERVTSSIPTDVLRFEGLAVHEPGGIIVAEH
ncbi:hypothetical protein MKK69_23550 [Methylobacterium sp. J-026]|uniref:hypothetical protein n=1 Tax=Methylobacterium sp. J-026 TaxID=2836624 RepID=UPI001FBB62C1|nr:hypothetical protein [Methylobacterium sp. J-026]MCJ2136987.1 hypothetical protein [Methylobacterium sp. J-026]